MLWRNRRESGNVIDRRGMGRNIGIGGLLVGAVFYYLMGGNPIDYLAMNAQNVQPQRQESAGESDEKKFASVVLADTEDTWSAVFRNEGKTYTPPKMVLFTGMVQSACGNASSATGPFYCPGDHNLYLDLSFFEDMSDKLGAPGDFASAYVIAHEVGHHVQTILGVDMPRDNRSSVMFELQADCLAGVWAKHTESEKKVLEPGDIDEAINAASAVGDDRLQQASRGEVVPDSFTHGSSEQRMSAFKLGYSKSMSACF